MVTKWWQNLDKEKKTTLLTDLSKAFDYLLLDLLMAKVYVYGPDYSSLQLIQSFLSNRKQRTRDNNA